MLATFVTLVGKEVCVFHCISFAEAHCVESGSESVGGAAILGAVASKVQNFMEAVDDSWQLSRFVRNAQSIKAFGLF